MSNQIGTSLTMEYDSSFPDFTLCPYRYTDKNVIINSESNHDMSDVTELLPSMKDMVLLIQKGEISYDITTL